MNFRKLKEISGHAAGVYSLDIFENALYSASADKFVARWKIDEGIQDKFSIRFDQAVYALCLFDNHSKLAVGLANGDLHFFELRERKEIKFYTQHRKAIFCLSENRIQNQLYASDADGNLSVWDTVTSELLAYLPFDCGKIRRVAISSDGARIGLACQDGSVRVLLTESLNQILNFHAHKDGVTSILFHPCDPEILFTGGKDAYLKKWNLYSGTCLKSIPAHHYAIYDLITLQDDNIMVSASRDKTIKVWDSETLEIQQRLDFKHGGHRHSVNALVKIDEYNFCSSSDDRKIIFWSVNVDSPI
jgi:WD40 repeat protein